MICEAEKLKTNEFVKRRILRLQQVREQSKDLAKKIRGRVKDERGRVLSDINKEKEKEVQRTKQRNIEHLKSQLEEGLAQVGAGHSAAIFEELLNKEWEVTKKINRSVAIERGNKAAEVLQRDKEAREGRYICRTKSKSPQKLQSNEPINIDNTTQQNTEENHIQTEPETQTQPQQQPVAPCVFYDPQGGGEHVDVQVQENSSKPNFVVNERGDGDYNKESVITANYFEVSPNRECDDTLKKFYPTETIRQLQLSEQPPTGSTRQSLRRFKSLESDRSTYYCEPTDLHAMSKNNPFSTVISDHIKNRHLKTKRPPLTDALPDDTPDDMSTLKSIIQHTRHAPPLPPSVPKLPVGYRKTDEPNINAGIKKSELTAATNKWLSPTKHHPTKSQSSDCKCTSCYCKADKRTSKTRYKPNLRQTLKSHNPRRLNSASSVTNTVKYVHNRNVIRCKPAVPSIHITAKSKSTECPDSTVRDRQCKYSELPKHLRTYDEMSKTERNSVPDSNYMVERHAKSGKSAFELAREEMNEAERRANERREYFNDQARKVRGMQAAEKLQKEREYQDIIKAIDNYEKEQRRTGKKIPDEAFMSEHRMKQKHNQEQRKMEKAYENAARQTKVHIYPGPITAPTVQPERRSGRGRDCDSDISSDEGRKEKTKSPLKKRPTRGQSSVVNVAEWNAASGMRDDDLDEIPTRDSDSTVKSIVVTRPKSRADEVMDINRVLNLIEKQKEQLLKEVARMEQLEKPREKSKSPRKKKQQPVVEIQTNSTTDDAVYVETKKKTPKQRSPSPKVKTVANPGNTLTVKTVDSNQQLSNGSQQSSVSFQGFQIVVEVKKSGKSEKKETVIKAERSVQTTKSLLESQDSSTEVSVRAAQVITTEKVMYQKDDAKSKSLIDSSASTSYMSPPDRFSRGAVETYFGKRLTLKTSETQTDVQTALSERDKVTKTKHPNKDKSVEMRWMKKQHFEGEPPGVNVYFNSVSTVNDVDDIFVHEKERNVRQCTRSSQPDNFKVASSPGQQYLSKRVLQPMNENSVARSNVIDPKLKKYIHQLLEISKTGVNKIEIDVSDVPTPTSSIVNVTSNITPALKQEYNEKVERLKLFIDENYSLLEQLEKERKFHKNYGKNKVNDRQTNQIHEKQCPEVSSSVNSLQTSEDMLEDGNKENRHTRSKKSKPRIKHSKQIGVLHRNKKHKHKTVESCESTPPERDSANEHVRVVDTDKQDIAFSSDAPKNNCEFVAVKNNVDFNLGTNDVRHKSPDVNNQPKVRKSKQDRRDEKTKVHVQSLEEQERNIQHYKTLSDECTQRIQNLTQMLDQVRKDKQMTLSSNTSPSSDDAHSSSQKLTSNDKDFVPILSNIPKPSCQQYTESAGEEIFLDVWGYDPQLSGIQQIPPLNLNVFEQQNTPGKRPKPPAAITRHPDMMQYYPHELSTIVEVETPGPGRNTSSVSKQTEVTPLSNNRSLQVSRHDDGYVDVQITNVPPGKPEERGYVDIQITNVPPGKPRELSVSYKKKQSPAVEPDVTDVNISPFISFQDFVKEYSLEGMDELLGDSTLKAATAALEISSESEDTLPDILAEMLKRDLIQKHSKNNSSRHGSGENSSTDSAVYILQTSTTSPGSEKSKKGDSNKGYPMLENNDVPSISGIDKILQTSSSSSVSENLMNEFNKALETMGIHWAVSTLKKTKETMDLSSSSSSARKEHIKDNTNKENDNEFYNITGTSVGLSTLLDGLNTNENSMFRKYAEDLSNSSINKQVEELLKRVSEIKKSIPNPDKSVKKINSRPANESQATNQHISPNVRVNLFTEEASISGLQGSKDKTQQRTSTPVKFSVTSSHSSSVVSAISHPSNGLFSNESDLSSVKNMSHVEKNVSVEDKDTLNVPDLTLKFGKLFNSPND